MIAIADASGDLSAAWSWPVWVFLAAVALVLYAFSCAPSIPNLDPTELDTHDPCAEGHYYVMDQSREFYQCADPACGHRVNRHGEALS